MIDDIEQNGHDRRKRKAFDTVRPATVAAVLSPYASGARARSATARPSSRRRSGWPAPSTSTSRLAETAPLRRLTPATLIGKGVVERMKAAVEEQGIGLVVVDDG